LLLCPISIQHNKRIIDYSHKFWVLIGWAGKLIYIWDLGILQIGCPKFNLYIWGAITLNSLGFGAVCIIKPKKFGDIIENDIRKIEEVCK